MPIPARLRRHVRPRAPARRAMASVSGIQSINEKSAAATRLSSDRKPWITSIRLTSEQHGRSSSAYRYSVAEGNGAEMIDKHAGVEYNRQGSSSRSRSASGSRISST